MFCYDSNGNQWSLDVVWKSSRKTRPKEGNFEWFWPNMSISVIFQDPPNNRWIPQNDYCNETNMNRLLKWNGYNEVRDSSISVNGMEFLLWCQCTMQHLQSILIYLFLNQLGTISSSFSALCHRKQPLVLLSRCMVHCKKSKPYLGMLTKSIPYQ